MGGVSRTFSMPKNLSLPSGRMGPALSSIFSSGVSSTTGSCCFFDAFEFGPGLDGPCYAESARSPLVTGAQTTEKRETHRAGLELAE